MSASEASREDRQLPASERRLQQAREEGQVPRSRDLAHLGLSLAMLALLLGLGPWLAQEALQLVGAALRFERSAAFEPEGMVPRLGWLGLQGLFVLVPVAGGLALVMAASSVAVGGWNVAPQALQPKFERVDPLAGFKRWADWRQGLQHLKVALLAAGLLAAAVIYLVQHAPEIDGLSRVPLASGLRTGFSWLAGGVALLAAVCFVAALADVPLQIFRHKANLRMTKEEARQEHKESEGDPHVRGERRRRQRELSRGRMLADVPQASVVITNPTHYAVALRYEEGMPAPRIVAMGADHLAFRIREVAAAARVPTLEAPPLARALYRHGDVGQDVPVELYSAVAQVLAWIYRVRTALRPIPAPVIAVPPGLDPQEAA